LSALSNFCDWALFYSIESDYSQPELKSGLIGGTRDGWLRFPWAKGVLKGVVIPTRGPYSSTPPCQEKNSFGLYTLYSIKGGLPKPSHEKCLKSLELHRETTTGGGVTPEPILLLARRFSEQYRSEFKPNPNEISLTNSSSSTYEYSRSDGGRGEFMKDTFIRTLNGLLERTHYQGSFTALGGIWNFESGFLQDASLGTPMMKEFSVLFLLDDACREGWVPRPTEEPLEGGPYTGRYTAPPRISFEDFDPKPYPARAVTVEEQGNKARVVTPAASVVASLLHLMRTYCYSSLKKDPEVGTISGDGTLVSFMKRANKFLESRDEAFLKDRVLLSLDLTRATDTFHMDVSSQLLSGYLSDPSTPLLVRVLGPLSTSSMEVLYEDLEDDVEPMATSRGIPMANPSSWFLLNLFNRFFWELSGALLREAPGRTIDQIIRNLLKGRFSKMKFRRTGGDPLTSRCGDDQISLTTKRRALLFERLLPFGGAIISAGVHMRSASFGTYTKQMCFLDRKSKKLRFLDILRVRSLSTPDSRLPGKKEVPPSWSRGIAASRELAWWTGPVYAGASTYLWWRYHEFLESAIRLKIEPWLPRKFGGLEFPHFRKEIQFLSPKTSRMLSILFRSDYNIENLLSLESLGSLWDPSYSGDLGKKTNKVVKYVLSRGSFMNIERARADGFLNGVETEIYPKWWTLAPIEERMKEHGWMPLKDYLSDLRGQVQGLLSWSSDLPAIEKVPSLRAISRKFLQTRSKILSRDSHVYQKLQAASYDELCKRLDWKLKVVYVWGSPSMILDFILAGKADELEIEGEDMETHTTPWAT